MGTCGTLCLSQSGCADGYYCDNGDCLTKKPAGVGCSMGFECESGLCSGVCI